MADAPPPPGPPEAPDAPQDPPPGLQVQDFGDELHIVDVLNPSPPTTEAGVENPAPRIVAVQSGARGTAESHVSAQVDETSTVKLEYSATATGTMAGDPRAADASRFANVGLSMIRPGLYRNPNVATGRGAMTTGHPLDFPTPASFMPGGQYYSPEAALQQQQHMQAMQAAMQGGYMPMYVPNPMMHAMMAPGMAPATSQPASMGPVAAVHPGMTAAHQPRTALPLTAPQQVPPVAVVTATSVRPAAPPPSPSDGRHHDCPGPAQDDNDCCKGYYGRRHHRSRNGDGYDHGWHGGDDRSSAGHEPR